MRAARRITVAAIAVIAAALGVAAHGAESSGRPPLTGTTLQGYFHQALWEGSITFGIAESGPPTIRTVDGILPGTCREKRSGRLVRSGPDGAIGFEFAVAPNARIRPDGTFAFTATVTNSGLTPHTITIKGRFYGNNVLGRAHGRSTTSKYDHYSSCVGDQPFWAKRIA
jgi:hypothetical protein